jgi:hypothetical protein
MHLEGKFSAWLSLATGEQLCVEFKSNAFYFKPMSGTKNKTRIPIVPSDEIAYFVGVIAGDGCLPLMWKGKEKKWRDYRILVESCDLPLLEALRGILRKEFNILTTISLKAEAKPNRKRKWKVDIRNKPLYLYLTRFWEMPDGKKSSRICFPSFWNDLSLSNKWSYIAGIFAADGGVKRRSKGLTTASKKLRDELVNFFESQGISLTTSEWDYKEKRYYDLEIRRAFLSKLECGFATIKKPIP